jgi:hypothetical protein
MSAARASEHAVHVHTARHSAGPRSAGLHRAPTARSSSVVRPSRPSPSGAGPYPSSPLPGPEDVSDLVSLADRLGNAGEAVRADDEFRDRLRQRLVAVASVRAVNPEPGFRPPPDAPPVGARRRVVTSVRRRVPRRVTVATGTLAGLVALSGVGFASGGAHPGDPLYGVKRSRESAQLTLARSPVARGALRLEFARDRLVEAAAVTANVARLDRLLDDMDSDTQLGMADLGIAAVTQHHPAPLKLVDEFALAQKRQLQRLKTPQISVAADSRITISLALLEAVRKRSDGLSSSVGCAGPFTSDYLGPLPRACSTAEDGDQGVSSVQPAPPTATWTSRPHPRSSGRTLGRLTATPSGSAAETSESPQSASPAAVEDDGSGGPWSTAENVEPQSGTVLPAVPGPPTTPALGSLVGSADDTVGGATSDLVERAGE